MTAKLIAFLLTLTANITSGVIILFFMLLALNGFSESDASWGLGAFIALAISIAVLMSAAAVFGSHVLVKKGFSSLVAVFISVTLCSIVGIVAEMISSVIGIAIADFVRRNY